MGVTWTVLAPATAIISALGMLTWSMNRLEAEVAALRSSLRRSRAAAVATDELARHTGAVTRRVTEIEHDARARADLRRSRRRSAGR
jgi:hypothetical protein